MVVESIEFGSKRTMDEWLSEIQETNILKILGFTGIGVGFYVILYELSPIIPEHPSNNWFSEIDMV